MKYEDIDINDLNEQHQELAGIIGIDNLLELASHFGGTQIYIPQMDKLLKNVKYKAIIEEFDGFNIRQLSKKYNVSESTIYRLVRDKIVPVAVKQIEGQMNISDYGL